MSEKIIYSMIRVSKSHNRTKIFEDVSLSYFYGAKIGVLGLNGAGKSTLLRILAGVDKEIEGEVQITPGYSVGYLEQEPRLTKGKTVREIVEEGAAETVALLKEYEEIGEKFAEPMSDAEMNKLLEKQDKLQHKIEATDAWDLDSKLDMAMDALRCPPGDTLVDSLSGGEQRRVAMCRLLIQSPDVLLLDEPTNHLDAETVAWLEHHLQRYPGTVIAVTHDRYFLDNVAGWILELDRGKGYPYKGNYTGWLKQKQDRMKVEENKESARAKALAREAEWAGKSAQGRQAKNKARLQAYEKMLNDDGTAKRNDLEIYIPPGPRLGEHVIVAKGVAKAYGDTLLYDDLNFDLPPNGIVGIVGPNGAGKTTLFRMITGDETPDAGTLELGPTVQLAYAEQFRDSIPDDMPVWAAISDGEEIVRVGKQDVNARAFAARFGFTGNAQAKPAGVLSGGERNRVHLARMLRSGANVLLLDEPTNDLDVNTMRALEDALENFAGCAVVITHDRWFLDRLATHILAFEGDSQVKWFEGNYSAYDEDRKKRLGHDADQPHRIKYRRLTR
ncbi:MAG: energy-dependent translational throttle protein EttA [Phycisphaera sp.]|nr:energy-dependent translational throttle protein EttA [Phycisphaera sp.]